MRWESRADGSEFARMGVIIYHVKDDRIVRLRRYMGPLEDASSTDVDWIEEELRGDGPSG